MGNPLTIALHDPPTPSLLVKPILCFDASFGMLLLHILLLVVGVVVYRKYRSARPSGDVNIRVKPRVWSRMAEMVQMVQETTIPSSTTSCDVNPYAGGRSSSTTGICFSGGGTRSCAASFGYLRGLRRLGILSSIDYITGVSGGSWAVVIYKFARSSIDEDTLLDTSRALIPKSDVDLRTIGSRSMGEVIVGPFLANLLRAMKSPLDSALVWQETVWQTYMRPLLPPGANRKSFTLSPETRDAIVARVPQLTAEDFVVARSVRPFPIIGMSALSPLAGCSDPSKFVGLEVTPLGVGSAARRHVVYRNGTGATFGTYIEPFAFGGAIQADGSYVVRRPLFSLAAACGASSMAVAVPIKTHGRVLSAAVTRFVPRFSISEPSRPPLDTPRSPPASAKTDASGKLLFGDGAECDNSGLMSLLARRVARIVVFVNSHDPYVRGSSPYEPPQHIDSTFRLLFGCSPLRPDVDASKSSSNVVFEYVTFLQIVAQFHACFDDDAVVPVGCCSRPLCASVMSARVLANPHWGIQPYTVERICFVLLQEPVAWYHAVPNRRGKDFERFPHFRTVFNNKYKLLQLTPEQVNMLADMCAYVIESIQEVMVKCLGTEQHARMFAKTPRTHEGQRCYRL